MEILFEYISTFGKKFFYGIPFMEMAKKLIGGGGDPVMRIASIFMPNLPLEFAPNIFKQLSLQNY